MRRRRLRLQSTAAAAPTLEAFGGTDGGRWQVGNSLLIGIGTLGVAFYTSHGDIYESTRTGILFACGTLSITTAVDILADYGDRLGAWFVEALVEAAAKRNRRAPASTAQTAATEPPTVPEPVQTVESSAVRDARHEMLRLLERAKQLKGGDGTQIPSDDDLGKGWGGTRRTRVVRYFGDALEVKTTGNPRGTFIVGHYTIDDLLEEVRTKTLSPTLPKDAAANG